MRKIDTFTKLKKLGLSKYLIKCKEYLPYQATKKEIKTYCRTLYKPSEGINIGLRQDCLPGNKNASIMLKCHVGLNPDSIYNYVKKTWNKNLSAIVSESFENLRWKTQGVIQLTNDTLIVELDGDENKTRICKFYDIGKFEYSYYGDWKYKGPYKSLIYKLMDIICKYNLINYHIEFTNFDKRGLIIWQLRDKEDIIPKRIITEMSLKKKVARQDI